MMRVLNRAMHDRNRAAVREPRLAGNLVHEPAAGRRANATSNAGAVFETEFSVIFRPADPGRLKQI